MTHNPYSDEPHQSPYAFQSQAPNGSGDNYFKQIPLVGIFNIIQASFELIMVFFLIGMSFFMGAMQNDPQFQKMPQASTIKVLPIIYIVLGALVGVVASMRLIAGIMILRRRGRKFAIVTSVVGLITVFTCYCSLTSIGVCVYSLVVLIQPSVIARFEPTTGIDNA